MDLNMVSSLFRIPTQKINFTLLVYLLMLVVKLLSLVILLTLYKVWQE